VKLSVFIATSLDGFIARENGALDWLHGDPGAGPPPDFGYQVFFDSVDALVMGRATFDVVRSFPSWPYGSKPVVVLSNRPVTGGKGDNGGRDGKGGNGGTDTAAELPDSVEHMSGAPQDIVARLEGRGWKHLYVDGGKTIQAFLAAGLIGRLIINRLPILLGSGIPLFGPLPGDIRLEHIRTQTYPGGMVQTEYRVKDVLAR
jgi:dihydrofolate reductase